jgi:flagellar biosynthesis protein FliR
MASFETIGLVALRLSPMLLSVGMGPMQRIPLMVRLVLLCVFTVAVSLLSVGLLPESVNSLTGIVVSELFIGFCIFFTFQLIYAALSFWGRVVDMQIGFGAAGVFDPSVNTQESITGSIYVLAAVTLFFILGIHVELVKLVLRSYQVIPIGTGFFFISPMQLAALMTSIFSTALLIFAPVMLLLWLLDMFTGFISRTMPQMNIYFVMMPLKIGCGLFVLSVFSKQSLVLFDSLFNSLILYWSALLN